MPSLSPKLPLTIDSIDGAYENIDNYKDLVAQHVKMLVLTSPGERIMDPNYGVGARRYLFEQNTIGLQSALTSRINQQFSVYLPYVEIQNIKFEVPQDSGNAFSLQIIYKITPLNVLQDQNISVFRPEF